MAPDLIAGRYRVQRSVGRGGMGEVWLCHDQVLGRDVAVKRVGSLPGESLTDTARALREARSSAALNHRNVVSVFDVVDDADEIWLVMEYVPSRTLSETIREDGPLPPARAARIGAQVAAGLAAAHEVGTIHRDVKPGNILVSDDDSAKVSDFGIARRTGDAQLTQTGLLTGTPAYFSPELARGADPGPASDVWALGATLYAAVEGSPPYPDQRNALAMLQTIASTPPPRPTRAEFLTDAIGRMMDRDPRSRWAMADAASALRRLMVGHPTGSGAAVFRATGSTTDTITAGATGAVTPANQPRSQQARPAPVSSGRDRSRGRHAPWALGLAAVVLLLVGAGYPLFGPDTESPSSGSGGGTPAEASKSPTAKESTDQESEQPESTGSRSQQSPTPSKDEARTRFVEGYFATVPDDTDAGWAQLAPTMQSVGRDDYEAFWDPVESVKTSRVQPVTGEPVVEIVLAYNFRDGRVVTERQRLTLQESGGDFLIADDEVLSSRTTSG